MREILVRSGDIKNETLGKTVHRWMFRYDEKSMNIKVELNKRIWKQNTYHMQKIKGVSILCMTPDCIFTNKLVALSDRFYNRNLYDVYFFFTKKFPIKESLIVERKGLSAKKFIQNLIKELPSHFTGNTILAGLGEVLTEKQKSRVKKSLLDEVIKLLKKYNASIK